MVQNPVNVLRIDTGQLGQELLDENVVPEKGELSRLVQPQSCRLLVYIVLVDDVQPESGRLGGVRLVPALLELLHQLGRGVGAGAPEDPQLGEVKGEELEPRD